MTKRSIVVLFAIEMLGLGGALLAKWHLGFYPNLRSIDLVAAFVFFGAGWIASSGFTTFIEQSEIGEGADAPSREPKTS